MASRSRYRPPPTPPRHDHRSRRRRTVAGLVLGATVVVAIVAVVVLTSSVFQAPGTKLRYAKDLPPPAPLPKLRPGQHLAGYSIGSLASTPTTAPGASPAALQTYPTVPAGSSPQAINAAYVAKLQQQGGDTTQVVRQYVEAVWCGPLSLGGEPQGNPVPPDPTEGLAQAQRTWSGAQALGPVKATFCTAGYSSKDFYFDGAPFGPRIGANGATSEPVAIELAYRSPSGAAYHVFFIEDVSARVSASERSILDAKLEALWVGPGAPRKPVYVTSPANFTIPPDAVISAAIGTRTPVPTNAIHRVRRQGTHPPLTVPGGHRRTTTGP